MLLTLERMAKLTRMKIYKKILSVDFSEMYGQQEILLSMPRIKYGYYILNRNM
jgi:hypothetical protein